MPTSVLLDMAAVLFPAVFRSFLPHLPPSYASSSLSGQTTALVDLCPGSHGSHSISWADSEHLYLSPESPGAFCAMAASGTCLGPVSAFQYL